MDKVMRFTKVSRHLWKLRLPYCTCRMARKTVLVDDHCMGTYVHGILDNTSFIDYLLKPFADQLAKDSTPFDYHAFKEEQYNRLADHIRQYVDVEKVYQIISHHA